MISSGTVRRIDDMGRITIPKEMRRELRLKYNDPLMVYFNDETKEIIVKRYDVEDD